MLHREMEKEEEEKEEEQYNKKKKKNKRIKRRRRKRRRRITKKHIRRGRRGAGGGRGKEGDTLSNFCHTFPFIQFTFTKFHNIFFVYSFLIIQIYSLECTYFLLNRLSQFFFSLSLSLFTWLTQLNLSKMFIVLVLTQRSSMGGMGGLRLSCLVFLLSFALFSHLLTLSFFYHASALFSSHFFLALLSSQSFQSLIFFPNFPSHYTILSLFYSPCSISFIFQFYLFSFLFFPPLLTPPPHRLQCSPLLAFISLPPCLPRSGCLSFVSPFFLRLSLSLPHFLFQQYSRVKFFPLPVPLPSNYTLH